MLIIIRNRRLWYLPTPMEKGEVYVCMWNYKMTVKITRYATQYRQELIKIFYNAHIYSQPILGNLFDFM